ncbi:MAG: cytochrome b/b6 domain-containing protein, partial [Pseudomonadota bacterium]
MDEATRNPPLWDIPTRVFHWSLVICMGVSWWSADQGDFEIHEWSGYTLIVLVISRIAWGFVGSTHSRFSDFLAGPRKIMGYLRGEASTTPGHNPLGGWSVMVLLTLILLQAVTGLFNTDDIFFNGPLYYAVSSEVRDTMGQIHEVAFDFLLGFVGLHIAAVLYHQFWRKEKLLGPMFTGSAEGRHGRAAPAPLWRALLIVGLASLALWAVIQNAPPPPA